MVYVYYVNYMIIEFLRIYLFLNIEIMEYCFIVKLLLFLWDLIFLEFFIWFIFCMCFFDIFVFFNLWEIVLRLLVCIVLVDMMLLKLILFYLVVFCSICFVFFVFLFISNYLIDLFWILVIGYKIIEIL